MGKQIFIAMSLLVLTSFPSSAQTAPSESKVRQATADLFLNPVTHSVQDIFSDSRRREAFQRQLHDSLKPQIQKFLHCDPAQVDILLPFLNMNEMQVTVTMPPADKSAAMELTKAAVEQLDKQLQDAEVRFQGERTEAALESYRSQENLSKMQKDQTEAEIQQLRNKLSQLGTIDVQVEDVASMAKDLDQERQKATIDAAARSARLEALQKTLAKLISDGEQKAKDDGISAELQKLIDLQQQKIQIEEQRYKAGLVSTPPLAEQTDLSNTKIRLLERREALSHPLGGDKLSELEAQVIALQADVAESQGRLKVIEDLAHRSAEAQQLAESLRDAEEQEKHAVEAVNNHAAEVRTAEFELSQIRPRSIINLKGIELLPESADVPAGRPGSFALPGRVVRP